MTADPHLEAAIAWLAGLSRDPFAFTTKEALVKANAHIDRLLAIARSAQADEYRIAEQLHHMQHGPRAWATLTDLGRAEYTKRLSRARELAGVEALASPAMEGK